MSDLLNVFFQIICIIAVCVGSAIIVCFAIGKIDEECTFVKIKERSDIEFSDESQEEQYVYNYYNSNTILSPLNEWRKKNGI